MTTEIKKTNILTDEEISLRESKKKKIIVILDASVRAGKDFNWKYEGVGEEQRSLREIKNLNERLKKKIAIFNKLDTNSYLFERIMETAKSAMRSIQEYNEFNQYSGELILKFLSLEEIFLQRKLKSRETKMVEREPGKGIEYKPRLEPKEVEIGDDDLIVPQGMTGDQLVRQIELNAIAEEELEENIDMLSGLDEEESEEDEDDGNTPPEPEDTDSLDSL